VEQHKKPSEPDLKLPAAAASEGESLEPQEGARERNEGHQDAGRDHGCLSSLLVALLCAGASQNRLPAVALGSTPNALSARLL